MFLTGFADEASSSIEGQIKATRELGWAFIESRNINGQNITDISDSEFDTAAGLLEDAGIRINCFGSAVANWAKSPLGDEDFNASVKELERALPRMKRLGTTLIRGMSFGIIPEAVPYSQELEKKVFKKVRHLVAMCEDAGVQYGHENCMNYGGMSWEHTLRLIEAVDSDVFTLIFDTGNPVGTPDYRMSSPYPKQNSFDFYTHIKEHITYVHIKDAVFLNDKSGIFNENRFTWPGEGNGDVAQIVTDLVKNGFDGGFSIEPHLAVVHHDDSVKNDDEIRYTNYVKYGRKFEEILSSIPVGNS